MSRFERAAWRTAVAAVVAGAALAATSPAFGIGENVKVPGTDTFPSTGEVTVAVNVPGRGLVTEKITLSSTGLPPAVMTRGALGVKQRTIPIELVEMALQGQGKTLGRVVLIAGSRLPALPPGTIPGVAPVPPGVEVPTGLPASTGHLTNVDASARIRGKQSNTHLTNPRGGLKQADVQLRLFWELVLVGVPGLGTVSGRSGDTPTPVDGGTGDSVPLNAPEGLTLGEFKNALNNSDFKCYRARGPRVPIRFASARIQDQFDDGDRSERVTVLKPVEVCNPVGVKQLGRRGRAGRRSGVRDGLSHLVCYSLKTDRGPGPPRDKILVGHRGHFTTGTIDVDPTSRKLCVTSGKSFADDNTGPDRQRAVPEGRLLRSLDHFACYSAEPDFSGPAGTPFGRAVLADQFEQRKHAVQGSDRFCNPAAKRHHGETTPIRNGVSHLIGFAITPRKSPTRKVIVHNQMRVRFVRRIDRDQPAIVPQPQAITTFDATGLLVPTPKRHCGKWTVLPPLLNLSDGAGSDVGGVKKLAIAPHGETPRSACRPGPR